MLVPSDFNPRSPKEERLPICSRKSLNTGNFNPRSPKEERQLHIVDQLYYTQQTELFHKLRQLISSVYINMIN